MGTVVLAVFVNGIEPLWTSGCPAIATQILAAQKLPSGNRTAILPLSPG